MGYIFIFRICLNFKETGMTDQPKRRAITFPAEIAKRGNAHYITILKSYMEMLGIKEGDVVDVTIRRPEEDQKGDDQ